MGRPEEGEVEDDAPESVTFESSKAVALEAFKSESATRTKRQAAKRDKKKNRKQKDEEESKSKLDLLKEQAEGIFDDGEQSAGNEGQPEVSGSSTSQTVNQVKRFDEEDSMDENEDVEEDQDSAEMIHGTTRFSVQKSSSRHGVSHVPQSVLDLKKELLYGKGTRIKREASKKSVERKIKMAATGKNVYA